MRIVQSYWSRPSITRGDTGKFNRVNGGWLEPRYYYYSWAFSCLKLKQFYPHVVLYTDKAGYDLMCDFLELPYTDVVVCLDEINHFNPKLWALGKIMTYGMQEEPFIHADGDIFIWEGFGSGLENGDLLAQNPEHGYTYYTDIIRNIRETFPYTPPVLAEAWAGGEQHRAINAGIIGGRDLAFIREFVATVFEFIRRNEDHLEKIDTGLFNIVFEQHLFASMAHARGLAIEYKFKALTENFERIQRFFMAPMIEKYIHPLSFGKKNRHTCHQLEMRLQHEFPEVFERINRKLREEANPRVLLQAVDDPAAVAAEKTLVRRFFSRTVFLIGKLIGEEQPEMTYTRLKTLVMNIFSGVPAAESAILIDVYEFERSRMNFVLKYETLKQDAFAAGYMERDAENIRLVYRLRPEDFLGLRFQLNDNSIFLNSMNYLSLREFEKEYDDPERETGNQTVIVYYSTLQNDYEDQKLDYWQRLICLFREPVSGHSIVEHILKLPNNTATRKELTGRVLYRITRSLLYDQLLRVVGVFLLFVLGLGLGGASAQGGGDVWTLRRCLDTALNKNISIQQAQTQVRYARIAELQAQQNLLPNAQFNTPLGYQFGRSINPITNTFTSLDLVYQSATFSGSVMVIDWGQLRDLVKYQQFVYESSAFRKRKVERDVLLSVTGNYLQSVLAREQLKISEVQLEQTRQQLAVTMKRFQGGSLPALAVSQMKVQFASDSVGVLTSRSAYETDIIALKGILNIDFGATFELAEEETSDSLPGLDGLGPLTVSEGALSYYPLMQADRLGIRAAETNVRAAGKALYPYFTFNYDAATDFSSYTNGLKFKQWWTGYHEQLDLNNNQVINMTLNVPIFNNGRIRNTLRQARVDLQNAKLQEQSDRIQLQQSIYTDYTSAWYAHQKLDVYRMMVQEAQKAYDLTFKGYQIGSIDAFTLITAQNALIRSKFQQLTNQYDYRFRIELLRFYLSGPAKMADLSEE